MRWRGNPAAVAFEPAEVRARLRDLERPVAVVRIDGRVGGASGESAADQGPATRPVGAAGAPADDGPELLAWADRLPASQLGDPAFRSAHAVELAYAAGAMATGIASEELV